MSKQLFGRQFRREHPPERVPFSSPYLCEIDKIPPIVNDVRKARDVKDVTARDNQSKSEMWSVKKVREVCNYTAILGIGVVSAEITSRITNNQDIGHTDIIVCLFQCALAAMIYYVGTKVEVVNDLVKKKKDQDLAA